MPSEARRSPAPKAAQGRKQYWDEHARRSEMAEQHGRLHGVQSLHRNPFHLRWLHLIRRISGDEIPSHSLAKRLLQNRMHMTNGSRGEAARSELAPLSNALVYA